MQNTSIATITLLGTAPMTQSHQHLRPKLNAERPDAYDERTWRYKLNTIIEDGEPVGVIPAFGFHQCLVAAAKFSQEKIPGQNKSTWKKRFEAGIMMMDDPIIQIRVRDAKGNIVYANLTPEMTQQVVISAHANGMRGSGTRVPRRFPVIPKGWRSKFDIAIIDPLITEDVFRKMLGIAGLFVGLGQYRPENSGRNGRFKVEALEWQDNREFVEEKFRYMNNLEIDDGV